MEYIGYINRFLQVAWGKKRDNQTIAALLNRHAHYYVLPLQLSSDAQIRNHSRFDSMSEVIEYVMRSFAQHAPIKTELVIKNHPLDAGLVNYPALIQRLARQFNVAGRVIYLESGDLNTLFKQAVGAITVNSTAGNLALELNCPTIALSDPLYNLPGLTFQGNVDDFWLHHTPPDAELYQCYRNAVIHTTQINGSFYCSEGIELAIKHATRILEAEQSPLDSLL
jgi:capsular polysaccharide export protein